MTQIPFNKNTDSIAITLKSFTILKNSENILDKDNEPYILSVAIDESGARQGQIDFNALPFPNVRPGDSITFDGHGHLIYGPKNPGSFVAYSYIIMESDKDVRDIGAKFKQLLENKAIDIGANALLQANPAYGTAILIVRELLNFAASMMIQNGDDELFRRNGTFFRNTTPPYDIKRSYVGINQFIKATTSIIALPESNNLGAQVTALDLGNAMVNAIADVQPPIEAIN